MGRPPRAGQDPGAPLAGDGETDLDCRPPAGAVARPHGPADPGPAGVRQDLQRRPDDRDAARGRASASASRAPATRSSATSSRRSSRPPRTEGVDVRPIQHGQPDQVHADDAGRPGEGRGATSRRGSRTAGRTSPRARPGCGSRPKLRRRRRRAVRRRGRARSRSPTSSRSSGPAASLVLLGDPQQLDQPMQGTPPARRRRLGAGARPRRPRHDARPIAACSSRPRGGSTRPCAASRPRCSTTTGSSPRRTCGIQRLDAGGCGPRRGRAAPHRGAAPSGADNESPEEAAAVASMAHALVEGGASWIDAKGIRRRLTWEDVLIVAPYNAQVADDRAAAARRAARVGHRRQVPGPGGADQHLLADDLEPGARAARDGLPVQRPPPQRRDVAGALRRGRRRLAGPAGASGRARRTRCGWRTRSAGSSRWPRRRRDDPASDAPDRRRQSRGPDARSRLSRAPIIAATMSPDRRDPGRPPRRAPPAEHVDAGRRRRAREHGPHRRRDGRLDRGPAAAAGPRCGAA